MLSADLAKQAFITTRLGADVSSFSTVAAGADCNSGIARDHEGLWLASLATSDSTTFVHTSKTGAPDGVKFTVPGYRAQDIEFDDVTFAPKCALWTNQATSTVPQVRAYQVPCGHRSDLHVQRERARTSSEPRTSRADAPATPFTRLRRASATPT